ncbi:hypothetical protein ACM258_15645 [Phaeobacter piscinae]|uniref:hypothetical protein n=1 Tax=Phaeobacter piscinae TaxID=1580596 RepID=UPI0039F737B9
MARCGLADCTTATGAGSAPSTMLKTGDSLPSLDAAARSDLTRQMAATQASEGKWRKALAALPAVDLPLAGPAADGAAEINHLMLSHNAPLTEVDVLSVASLSCYPAPVRRLLASRSARTRCRRLPSRG